MTYRIGAFDFSGAALVVRGGLAACAFLALGACATSSIDDLAPTAGTTSALNEFPAAPDTDPLETPAKGGELSDEIAQRNDGATIDNTGQYPNLNILPKTAAEQLTPEEIAAKKAALREVQTAATTTTPAKPGPTRAQLRKLAATHGTATLKEIEGE